PSCGSSRTARKPDSKEEAEKRLVDDAVFRYTPKKGARTACVTALVKAIQSPDCLWGSIAKYYGEQMKIPCGHCTQCRRKKNIA
ncbi:hypothetical protein, partial [uncultured Bacteroides sp.]|uniref:hypothetical protein n=1 Tax=uncultured Bacteroides sp. TaxID=162156 RepID=UPI0025D57E4B